MSEDLPGTSTPKKLQRLSFGGNGKFMCVAPLSSDFVSHFCTYRQKFHDSRPSGSKIDFGWYKELKKQWSKWTEDGRSNIDLIPSKSILEKLWKNASRKPRQIENIFSTPTVDTVASKSHLSVSARHYDDSCICRTATLRRCD